MTTFDAHLLLLASAAGHGEQRVIIFFAQVLLLIVVGRLLSEWMQRIGQPAVIGQLLAGIILGPSVFGWIWPSGQQAIFPPNSADRQMLNAVSELGVLLLLLLTGMETDLALVKRVRRSAAITSAAGIVIPFACGYALGEMLPDSVLPDANRRLLTSLFLATALSIPLSKSSPLSSARWIISAAILARSSSQPRSWMTPSAGRFLRLSVV
jgi:K+:H+ antiporter